MNTRKHLLTFALSIAAALMPVALMAEQTPRWVKKGVEELDKKRTNNTYAFHIVHTFNDKRDYVELAPLQPLKNYIDTAYHATKGSLVVDSIPATSTEPTTYMITFDRDGHAQKVYARLVDEFQNFEDYADGEYEYNFWQLYAISDVNVIPDFDRFTISEKYNKAKWKAFVPGLAQIAKGQNTKGYVIMGAEAALLATTLYATIEYNHYITHDHESKRATFRQLRWFTGTAAVALYIYNICDAFISPGARYIEIKRPDAPSMQLTFTPLFSPEMAGVGLHLTF